MQPLQQVIQTKYDPRGVREARRELAKYRGESRKAFGDASEGAEKYSQKTQSAASKTSGLSGKMKGLGAAAKRWIAGVAVGAALALSAALYKAGRQAVAFEEAMIGVRKTTGLFGEDFRQLNRDLLTLSARLGTPQVELARIAEAAGQLNIRGRANILAFTDTVAKLERVTELTAEEAAVQVARISNAFALPIEQAGALGSVLNELSNTTTATAGNVSDALNRIGGAGRSLGLSLAETAAMVATTIDQGLVPERAGTALRNVFLRFQTEAEALGRVVGMTGEEFSAMVQEDALGTINTYLEAVRGLPPALQAVRIKEVFGQENFTAVEALTNASERFGRTLTTSNNAFASATSLADEYAISMESLAAQWSKFTARFFALSTKASTGAMNVLQSVLETLNKIGRSSEEAAEEFGNLSKEGARISDARAAVTTYEELSGRFSLTAGEAQRLEDAISLLQDRYPGYIRETNAAGEAVSFYGEALRGAIQGQEAFNRFQQRATIKEIVSNYDNATERLGTLRERAERLSEELAKGGPEVRPTLGGPIDMREIFEEAVTGARTAEAEIRSSVSAIIGLFQTADGIDLDGLTDMLSGVEGSFDAAREKAEALVSAYREMKSQSVNMFEMVAGGGRSDAPSGEGAGPSAAPNPLSEEQLAAIRKAQEAFAKYREAAEIAAASSGKVADRLRDVAEAQAQVRELEDIVRTTGSDEAQEALRTERARLGVAKERLETDRAQMEQFKLLADAMNEAQAAAPAALGQLGLPTGTEYGIGQALERYEAQMTRLNNLFSAGEMSAADYFRAVGREGESFVGALQEAYQQMRRLGLLTPEMEAAFRKAFDAAERGAEGAGDEAAKLGKSMMDIARAGRGVLNLADAFGDLDDSVRQFAQGALDAVDNVGRLIEMADEAGSLKDLFTGASALGAAVPIAGAAAGVASMLSGFVSSISDTGAREEYAAMRESLRRNAEATYELTMALRESARLATDVAQTDVAGARSVFEEYGQEGDFRKQPVERQEEAIRDLEDLGIEALDPLIGMLKDNLGNAQFFEVVFRGLSGDIDTSWMTDELREVIDGTLGALGVLEEGVGRFGKNFEGILDRAAYRVRTGAASAAQAFQDATSELLGLDLTEEIAGNDLGGAGVEGGPSFSSLLEEIQNLDLSTEEGRARLKEIRAMVGEAVADGLFEYGALTPEQVDRFLDTSGQDFSSDTAGGEAGPYRTSVSREIGITSSQSNILIDFVAELLYWVKQMAQSSGIEDGYRGGGAMPEAYGVPESYTLAAGEALPVAVVSLPPALQAALDAVMQPEARAVQSGIAPEMLQAMQAQFAAGEQHITTNIYDATDPQAVAEAVRAVLVREGRRGYSARTSTRAGGR